MGCEIVQTIKRINIELVLRLDCASVRRVHTMSRSCCYLSFSIQLLSIVKMALFRARRIFTSRILFLEGNYVDLTVTVGSVVVTRASHLGLISLLILPRTRRSTIQTLSPNLVLTSRVSPFLKLSCSRIV
ncbi:hypothetical protein EV421DRAFT_113916 [Armillaria borealis]|uniref:Uncharacterized protein n=1 Tax=Armillaria borealis TaxID=47425 RepID=A0AA39JWZ5_9AGAR|nr:hypothetical protein EV421DRAFT_113916 [Armillaria borealis]